MSTFYFISMNSKFDVTGNTYFFGLLFDFRVRVIVFNATFNNISVISWKSVLLVEETGVPGEHHKHVASH